MDNKNIIELYKNGVSIKDIAHKYYDFKNSVYCREQYYHTIGGYNVNKYYYSYKQALVHVRKLILDYIMGYFD